MREQRLYAKLSKCSFFKTETLFLGHVISRKGIHVNPEKVEVVKNWPVPKNASELKSFLGLGNCFKRFVGNYSSITRPLVELTKPDVPFLVTEECLKAFELLKTKLTSAPVLAIPDETKPYNLICDASGFATGAALTQEQGLISYFSYKMKPAETRYHPGEQELLGVIRALEHYRPYLEGCAGLTITTDHKPNIYLDDKTPAKTNNRQVRWMQFLSRFHYTWEWKKGSSNVADALSRNPRFMASIVGLNDFPSPSAEFLDFVARSYVDDQWFADPKHTKNLKWTGQFWTKHNLIVIPNVKSLRRECLLMHHDSPYSGHIGRDRTLHLIQRHF